MNKKYFKAFENKNLGKIEHLFQSVNDGNISILIFMFTKDENLYYHPLISLR